MASSPTFDPNDFAEGISRNKYAQLQEISAEKNRATQEIYAPGSIFKVVTGLAALEGGLNPERVYTVEADPADPNHGMYFGRGFRKKDTAPPGTYRFSRAVERSSNSYFIQVGLAAGKDRITYVDFTFSAPKSVSVAMALAPTEAERHMIVGAHRDAWMAAMDHLEGIVAHARKGKGGAKRHRKVSRSCHTRASCLLRPAAAPR